MDGRNTQLYRNLGTHVTKVVHEGSVDVMAFRCVNKNAAARYLQLFDSTTVPASGAVPTAVFTVPLTSAISVGSEFFSLQGLLFKDGLVWAFSTTEATYTAGAAADQVTHIVFSRR